MSESKHTNYDSICSIGEEIINTEELNLLLKNKSDIVAYDGFEPSGRTVSYTHLTLPTICSV